MNRLVGLILLLSHGVLSLLGHAGLHALVSNATGCCSVQAESTGESASQAHQCCHHGCAHGVVSGSAASSGNATKSSDDGRSGERHAPTHDSRNCRLCEWYHNAHAPVLPQIELIVVASIPSVVTVFSESCIEQPVSSKLSRGPPVVG